MKTIILSKYITVNSTPSFGTFILRAGEWVVWEERWNGAGKRKPSKDMFIGWKGSAWDYLTLREIKTKGCENYTSVRIVRKLTNQRRRSDAVFNFQTNIFGGIQAVLDWHMNRESPQEFVERYWDIGFMDTYICAAERREWGFCFVTWIDIYLSFQVFRNRRVAYIKQTQTYEYLLL